MSACCFFNVVEIIKPEALDGFRGQVRATVERYGGRYVQQLRGVDSLPVRHAARTRSSPAASVGNAPGRNGAGWLPMQSSSAHVRTLRRTRPSPRRWGTRALALPWQRSARPCRVRLIRAATCSMVDERYSRRMLRLPSGAAPVALAARYRKCMSGFISVVLWLGECACAFWLGLPRTRRAIYAALHGISSGRPTKHRASRAKCWGSGAWGQVSEPKSYWLKLGHQPW